MIKIRFVCFLEDKVSGSCVRSNARSRDRSNARSHNHRFRDHSIKNKYI